MNSQLKCRFCQDNLSLSLVDLGSTPLANSYLKPEQLNSPEPSFPLHVKVCNNCRLAQVESVTTPENIFSDYAYFSSYSSSWVDHARQFTKMTQERFGINADHKVVEIASNDGYLLQHFVAKGIPALGIEPAANVAKVAEEKNVPTDVSFFGLETAERLSNEGHSADLIIGNNVYAHVPDINDFTAGMAHLLKPEGVISLEFPHLLKLIKFNQFDTIYHEHFSYLSLLAVEKIFEKHGLRVFDVDELPTHGGSLRVLGCLSNNEKQKEQPGLLKVRKDENKAGLMEDRGYLDFEPKVKAIRDDLLRFLRKAKEDKKTVAAYGAAAKGNTLLNYCKIGEELIDYVVDRNPHKQNHFLPGSHLPIYAPEKIFETKPDYVLILPWNLRDEISASMEDIKFWGGKFVVAIPHLEILQSKEELNAIAVS